MNPFNPQFIQDNLALLLIVLVWEFFWKGIALWYAARRGSKPWFVILLIVNSIGILPIIYLFATKSLSLSGSMEPTTPEDKK